jgi:hypothetical protein
MRQRRDLSAEIREDVSQVISEELADAPSTVTEDDRRAIEDDLMGRTNQILEALSMEERRSAGAHPFGEHPRGGSKSTPFPPRIGQSAE